MKFKKFIKLDWPGNSYRINIGIFRKDADLAIDAGTNFASLTRDVFRRASTGGVPGFPDEFSDVVRSQARTLL